MSTVTHSMDSLLYGVGS